MNRINPFGSKADISLDFKSIKLKIKFKCKLMITVETNVKSTLSEIIDFNLDKTENISILNTVIESEVLLFP